VLKFLTSCLCADVLPSITVNILTILSHLARRTPDYLDVVTSLIHESGQFNTEGIAWNTLIRIDFQFE